MGKLFKYLRQHAGVVLAIIVVLFVQAFCDLSLPTYTSDIVNVGIQQGGIDTTVPEQMKAIWKICCYWFRKKMRIPSGKHIGRERKRI